MVMTLEGRVLNKIAIVDDDESVRASYIDNLSDLDVELVDVPGFRGTLPTVFGTTIATCDAVVSDLILKKSGYAEFNGGELAVHCRQFKIPAILCTSYSDVNEELQRRERRYITTILPQSLFDLDRITEGLSKSICEIDGRFAVERRPWRTQIEVVDVAESKKYMWVIVMGRSSLEKVKIYINELPAKVQEVIERGRILHALVNTGAKSVHDLYFDEWELE